MVVDIVIVGGFGGQVEVFMYFFLFGCGQGVVFFG